MKNKILCFGAILAMIMSAIRIPVFADTDPIPVIVYEDQVPYQFMTTGAGSRIAKNTPYAGGIGTSQVTSAHYDLRNVKKMKTKVSYSAGGWTSASIGYTWYDKNGTQIGPLNGSNDQEVDVAAAAQSYDLSECYCKGWCSGSAYLPHGAGDSTEAWPGYWFVQVTNLTATVTVGNPKSPQFSATPGGNLTHLVAHKIPLFHFPSCHNILYFRTSFDILLSMSAYSF